MKFTLLPLAILGLITSTIAAPIPAPHPQAGGKAPYEHPPSLTSGSDGGAHPHSTWGGGGVSAGAPPQAGGVSVTAPGQDTSGFPPSDHKLMVRGATPPDARGKCPPGQFFCPVGPAGCCEVRLDVRPPPTHPYHVPVRIGPAGDDSGVAARGVADMIDDIEGGAEEVKEKAEEAKEKAKEEARTEAIKLLDDGKNRI